MRSTERPRTSVRRASNASYLTDLLQRDALVWGGYSAGICVLAPSLAGLETVDDPEEVRRVYGAAAIPSGLGVLDYGIVPHVDSPDHPESEACGEVAKRYSAEGVPHRTLRDGEAIVVHGDSS
jgi:dipeptidase E